MYTRCFFHSSTFDGNSHRPRRSRDNPGGVIFVKRVEVFALLLCDGLALRHRDFADLVLIRLAAALLGLDQILEHDAGRRGLDFKAEGSVLVDRDEYANDLAFQRRGGGIELLDELSR